MRVDKIFLMLCMIVLLSFVVFGQSANLNEEYTASGYVLLNGNPVNMTSANITIIYPNGTYFVTSSAMNVTTQNNHQLFTYIYTPTQIGEYTHIINFYNGSTLYALGFERVDVVVGDELTKLEYGTCARSGSAMALMIFMIILGLVALILGFMFHYGIGVLGGILLVVASLYIFPCSLLMGYIVLFMGLVGLGVVLLT